MEKGQSWEGVEQAEEFTADLASAQELMGGNTDA